MSLYTCIGNKPTFCFCVSVRVQSCSEKKSHQDEIDDLIKEGTLLKFVVLISLTELRNQ
jgi:hypothetical protein